MRHIEDRKVVIYEERDARYVTKGMLDTQKQSFEAGLWCGGIY